MCNLSTLNMNTILFDSKNAMKNIFLPKDRKNFGITSLFFMSFH